MRRKSAIGKAMKVSLVESARQLTPEQRLNACVNLARTGAEIHAAGERYRGSEKSRKP